MGIFKACPEDQSMQSLFPVQYFFIFVFLAILTYTVPAQTISYDDALNSAVGNLEQNLKNGARVAVVNFNCLSETLAETLIDEVSGRMANNRKFTVLTRTDMEHILKEQNLGLSGNVSDETAVSIGKLLQAYSIILGSINYTGNGTWRFAIRALNVETGELIQGSWYRAVVLENEELRYYRLQEEGVSSPSRDPKLPYLNLALRVGFSPRFYTLSEDIQGNAPDTGITFEGGIQFSALWSIPANLEIGAQVELLYGADTVEYSGTDRFGDFTAAFNAKALSIPLLAKISYRLKDRFVLPLFTGVVFNIPLGNMDYASGDISGSYTQAVPAGFVLGTAPGIRLGPGTLFVDIRFAIDFGNTGIQDNTGTLAVYNRSALSFSLGYEIGLLK